jgi:Predicted membrane protein, hemolysin III homolog
MVSRPLIAQGYSLAEEIANSISHGIGLVFGIVGLVLLLVQAVDANASAMAITSYSLYGGSMILLFPGLDAVSRDPASAGQDVAQEV